MYKKEEILLHFLFWGQTEDKGRASHINLVLWSLSESGTNVQKLIGKCTNICTICVRCIPPKHKMSIWLVKNIYVRRFSQEARTSFQEKKILQLNVLLFAKINLIKLNSLHPLTLYQVDVKPLSTQKLNSIKHKQLCSIKTKTKIDTNSYSLNPISWGYWSVEIINTQND